ncbi:hypothetical protein FB451DRAFT_1411782 [Mycena latifolia]|nr:hypothetical protein FB451DRAFT_1411782 [Mycena latifolia]
MAASSLRRRNSRALGCSSDLCDLCDTASRLLLLAASVLAASLVAATAAAAAVDLTAVDLTLTLLLSPPFPLPPRLAATATLTRHPVSDHPNASSGAAGPPLASSTLPPWI